MDDTDGFTCVGMTRITFRDFQGTFDLIDIITYALGACTGQLIQPNRR